MSLVSSLTIQCKLNLFYCLQKGQVQEEMVVVLEVVEVGTVLVVALVAGLVVKTTGEVVEERGVVALEEVAVDLVAGHQKVGVDSVVNRLVDLEVVAVEVEEMVDLEARVVVGLDQLLEVAVTTGIQKLFHKVQVSRRLPLLEMLLEKHPHSIV